MGASFDTADLLELTRLPSSTFSRLCGYLGLAMGQGQKREVAWHLMP